MADFTSAHEDLRACVRDVRDMEIRPLLERRGMDRPLTGGELKAVLRPLLALGYPGTIIGREDGGAGLDYVSLGITIEELAPVLGFLGLHVVPGPRPGQGARRWMPQACWGEKAGTAAAGPPLWLGSGWLRRERPAGSAAPSVTVYSPGTTGRTPEPDTHCRASWHPRVNARENQEVNGRQSRRRHSIDWPGANAAPSHRRSNEA